MRSAVSAPEAFLDEPNTIVDISGEDGDLHARMPGEDEATPFAIQPPATDQLTDGLPLPAVPHAPAPTMRLSVPEEPTLIGISPRLQTALAPVRFKIRLANREGIRSKASYLVEKMYSWRGYGNGGGAAPSRNRVTLVASDAQKALATISVGFDSPDGLMVDALYKDEVDQLRAHGAKLCEFTKLAVERDQQSLELLAMLFHIAYMYAYRINQATDLLIEVNPRHVRFYQRMLGFRLLGPERSCERVGGAPALLMWLRLKHAAEQIDRYGGHREMAGQVRSLYPHFFAPGEEDGIVNRLKAIG